MPINSGQKGSVPILLLLAALGLLIYLFITNTFSFKDKLFNKLFPKPPSHAQEQAPSVPDEILLKFKPGVPDKAKDAIRNQHGLNKVDEIKQIGVERVKVSEQTRDKIIEALKKNPQIEYAEPNYITKAALTPNDTYFSIRTWWWWKISAPSAWDISTGTPSAVIAILDTGVNYNHEDLSGKVIGTPLLDDNGHGTAVAGVAAAHANNGIGVASVCWLCPILSFEVLDNTGTGTDYSGAQGLTAAADQGAKVANMSWGGYSTSSTLSNAVNYAWNKGMVMAAGAGNDSTTNLFYPAAYNNVIAVANSDSSDGLDPTSNFGPWVDVAAPGSGITTTTMDGSYQAISGTSISSPFVAGLAGLIFSANPLLTNQQVVDIITSTADNTAAGKRINAYAALQAATVATPSATPSPTSSPTPSPTSSPTPPPLDTTPPTVSITSPINGGTVKANSKVNITASASDNVGISKVEFYVGGSLKCSVISSNSTYSCTWSVPGKKGTNYNISAKAYDSSNNTNTSSITVKSQ